MDFTYNEYIDIIRCLKKNKYMIHAYGDKEIWKGAILRHDVDMDVNKAVEFAKIEEQEKVSATYFVLVSSNLYNIFDKSIRDALHKILELGGGYWFTF